MLIKGVRPRAHLAIDLLLFGLLSMVAFSALMEHAVPGDEPHLGFMFHVMHGITGIAMCLTISVHLVLHLAWIKSQLPHLFKNRG